MDEAYKKMVINGVEGDILFSTDTGWVYWPMLGVGMLEAPALRAIADELDRRNNLLFMHLDTVLSHQEALQEVEGVNTHDA